SRSLGTISGTKHEAATREPGERCDSVARPAREYLQSGAAGGPCAHLAAALAGSVLDEPDVQLARNVLEGEPFALARATELAERVLVSSSDSLSRKDVSQPSGAGAGGSCC